MHSPNPRPREYLPCSEHEPGANDVAVDNGSLQKLQYTASSEEYTYYPNNRLSALVNKSGSTIIEAYSYIYDGAGNQTSKTDAKGTTTYTYDTLNRLLTVTEPDGKVTSYTYDAAGNRATETVTVAGVSITTTYTYNELNRLLQTEKVLADGSIETMLYAYDANGNMLSQMQSTIKNGISGAENADLALLGVDSATDDAIYEYDVRNRLVRVSQGENIVQSTYNGEGLRIAKTVNGQTLRYLYEYGRIILETDGSGNETARNVYGTNLISRTVSGQTLHYLYNGHADVTALINGSAVVASYYYDDFGVVKEETGTADNPYRYSGYEYDKETELYNLKARFYKADLARFLQEDSYRGILSDPLSLNLYTYCNNNPIRYFDPTGHAAVDYEAIAASMGLSTDSPYRDVIDCMLGNGGGFDSAENVTIDGGTMDIYSGGDDSGDYSSSGDNSSAGTATVTVGPTMTSGAVNAIALLICSGKNVDIAVDTSLEKVSNNVNGINPTPTIEPQKSTNKLASATKPASNSIMQKQQINNYMASYPPAWATDALERGWGPISKSEYERRMAYVSLTAASQEPSKTKATTAKDYLYSSGKQLLLGNYTDDVTLLGTAGQIGTSIIGVDLPADIRDITYDLQNWEWTWSHAGQTAIDTVGVLPLVGGIKYTDEVAALLKDAGKAAKTDFVVTTSGEAIAIPKGATGPVDVVNSTGKTTGFGYTGGKGGVNGQVSNVRIMDPTPPRGKSPGYPNGYVKYENRGLQGVDPVTGRTLPNSQSHFSLNKR